MTFKGELKGFQEEAFQRMIERKKVLVGYEMGLGKTVISIAAVEHLLEEGEIGTALIVVPSSLKYQWLRSIKQFTEHGIAMVIDGDPQQRKRQYEEVMDGATEYVIMNYEQVVNDWEFVRHLPRDCVVLDEATAIKNPGAKRTRRIKRLTAPYRFALTGQPVENKAEEIFSIMQWVNPKLLGEFDVFDRTFIVRNHWGKVIRYKQLPLLHKTLTESMVRKTRQDPDVRDQMPRVGEEMVTVTYDAKGAALYRHIAGDLLAELDSAMAKFGGGFDLWAHYHGESSGQEMEARGRIMSRLTCLRMLCDHPDLLRRSAAMYDASHLGLTGMKGGSVYAKELADAKLLDGVTAGPKLKATIDLVNEILSESTQNKVVVFAFFKDMLRMLQEGLTVGSVLFTGDMSAKQKDAAKEKFQTDPNVRLFLSSDAGGYGVDLPNANYLISYDLPWSAGKLDQRNARIIRLSSEFEAVTLLYTLMEGSIEERQLSMLEQKQAIGSAITDGKGHDTKGGLNLDLKGLRQFLIDSDV